jgi:O-antigen/teichoic acid export membrane protein
MSSTDPVEATADENQSLAFGRSAARGLGWSLVNNFVGRLGSFLAGIVVVRLIATSEYGVYAVGMVVLAVLLSMNELGVSVAIVQHRGDVAEIAPTVMTVSIVSSLAMAVVGYMVAPTVAAIMRAPEATGLIRLLLVAVVLDGIAAVPNALMSRLFQQRKRLVIDTMALVVSMPLTIVLAATGHGAWSLGWGAVVGNAVTAVGGLVGSPLRVFPGWDHAKVAALLRFGLPLAGASLLSLLMLNVDYIVVGHQLGPTALGLYLLAFNLCSWPITVVTSAIRRVATALFARISEHFNDGGAAGFTSAFALVVGITVPMCVLLAGFAPELIGLLYGRRWLPAAVALGPLAILSLVRVAVELTYDFLAGSGRTRSTVWLHSIWLVALVPTLLVGARFGIRGVAVGHAMVAIAVVTPTLAVLVAGAGIRVANLGRHLLRPSVGALAMVLVMLSARMLFGPTVTAMLLASPLAVAAYMACVWPLRAQAALLWQLRAPPARCNAPTVESEA